MAGGVEGNSAVPRQVVHETKVPAAYQPEDVLDPEPAQGLGYRFVYFDLSPLCCLGVHCLQKSRRAEKDWSALPYPPERYIHSGGPGSTRPSMRRPSPSCPFLHLLFWLLRSHHANAGQRITAVIHGREEPFVVLCAHSNIHRAFTEDDISFMQAVANVLGGAIERNEAQERLEEVRQRGAV
jgi:hypothetical protein